MSGRSYYDSKPIIQYHSRDARDPRDSRDSSSYYAGSGSSRDKHSSSSHSSMSHEASRETRHRDAHDERKFVPAFRSKSDRVEVIDHQRPRYDQDEPRASHASSKDYKETRKHSSSKRSDHR